MFISQTSQKNLFPLAGGVVVVVATAQHDRRNIINLLQWSDYNVNGQT